jgi:hypothetical protein
MLYIFFDLNIIFTKAKVLEVFTWASINMNFNVFYTWILLQFNQCYHIKNSI